MRYGLIPLPFGILPSPTSYMLETLSEAVTIWGRMDSIFMILDLAKSICPCFRVEAS